jgi:hypothetical protein
MPFSQQLPSLPAAPSFVLSQPQVDSHAGDAISDDEFPRVSTLLERTAKPARKVAGSRRPGSPAPRDLRNKGKASTAGSSTGHRRKASGASPSEPPSKKKAVRGGRVLGASNYNEDDLTMLMDILEEVQPTGGKGWNIVAEQFNEWAGENERPTRPAKSLEAKFKQVCIC